MNFDPFLFQVALSFILGGGMVAFAVTLAEKSGPRVGAALLTIPTTALVALFFIASTNSASFITEVIPFSVISLGVFMLFLAIFIFTTEKLGKIGLVVATICWFILAFFTTSFQQVNFIESIVFFLITYVLANIYVIITKHDKVTITKKTNGPLMYRVLASGFIIALAVILSKIAGPLWGGLFSMFPASTITSYALLLQHKKEFVISVARRMVPLSIVFLIYALSVYVAYPLMGIYSGTLVSVLTAIGAAHALDRRST